jgi:hypothetical protein
MGKEGTSRKGPARVEVGGRRQIMFCFLGLSSRRIEQEDKEGKNRKVKFGEHVLKKFRKEASCVCS